MSELGLLRAMLSSHNFSGSDAIQKSLLYLSAMLSSSIFGDRIPI